ncbi:MAG: hypothetical protein AB7S75_20535 [Desulfococcaceae bacterium]
MPGFGLAGLASFAGLVSFPRSAWECRSDALRQTGLIRDAERPAAVPTQSVGTREIRVNPLILRIPVQTINGGFRFASPTLHNLMRTTHYF